ncbi:MAG: protein kinase [Mycobacterium sp.]|nr:protein kinase [Mycobacterium sp.]
MDEVFGRYRLRGLLGAGGMGEVYRAYDTELDREIAIKILPAQASVDHTFEQRFRREARIAASLGDPHVVPIHDSGEIDGRLFIAMQLSDGQDLATELKRGPMSPDRAVIDTDTNRVSSTIAVSNGPSHVVLDQRTQLAFVTGAGTNTVSIVDGESRTVTRTIAVGESPRSIAVDPDSHTVYVANSADSTLSVIEPGTKNPASIRTGKGPENVAVDTKTHTVYVTNGGDNTVSVIKRS